MKTGFKDLDNAMCVERGEVVVVGGVTSIGVSCFLRQLAFANMENGVHVQFLDLQHTTNEHLMSVLSQQSGIERRLLSSKTIKSDVNILKAIQEQQERDIANESSEGISGEEFQSLVGILAEMEHCKNYEVGNLQDVGLVEYVEQLTTMPELLIIDPIQFGCFKDDKGAELSIAMKLLKQKALKDETVVFVGSRVSRNVNSFQGHRPRLQDLSDSSSLENVADKVLLVLRREYYDPLDKPGLAEIVVAKNRTGKTGSVYLSFVNEVGSFSDYSPLCDTVSDELDNATLAAFEVFAPA